MAPDFTPPPVDMSECGTFSIGNPVPSTSTTLPGGSLPQPLPSAHFTQVGAPALESIDPAPGS